jgi:glucose-6-phosphate isomerase
MTHLTELFSWNSLKKKAQSLQTNLSPMIASNPLKTWDLHSSHLKLDIYHSQLGSNTLDELLKLAQERNLKEQIDALIHGEKINYSEKRPALHTALRTTNSQSILIDGQDIMQDVLKTRETMSTIASRFQQGLWLGHTGRPIKSIVHIGIGGSELGPRFCIHALREYCSQDLSYHFVSDIDPNSFENATNHLEPETTLFIVASKSFTTQETLYNANKAFAFIGNPKHYKDHFIAVTANEKLAKQLGITTVLPIWDWVGGRFSLCSAVNLITCIAIGYERFTELLAGANSMDRHFQHHPFEDNLPVILALIGIWNINFLNIPSHLFLVYSQQLEQFVPYIQQLDMESNGKSTDIRGRQTNYATGPIIWGGSGNQAQHSYYQLLCQGSHKIAADFISVDCYENKTINNYCNAKIHILSNGVTEGLSGHDKITGKMPINHLRLKSIDPFSLGELIALYEHKIFVQGIIWGINSFDQPGVESAKRFGKKHFDLQLMT